MHKDIEVNLVEGRLASFEVKLGDVLLFSKLAQNRFPTSDEILQHSEFKK